ncbi:MAG TPA: cytochrome c [Paracoccus sp. (in: a-proteobacteria)]|nr:cytochrome c [Paracoccus sp. (in: a-proteobacteria)]
MRLILAAALTLTPMMASAQDDSPEEMALEARHGYMVMLASNMGPLAAMAKGEIPYDEAVATFHANNIAALANYEVEMHFLPGTAKGEIEGSDALPKAWQNLEDVRAKHENLKKAALAAPEGVKGGPEQVAAVVQNLGGACKSCHDEYRAK